MVKYSRENIIIWFQKPSIEGRDFTTIQDFDGIIFKNHAPHNLYKGVICQIDEKYVYKHLS